MRLQDDIKFCWECKIVSKTQTGGVRKIQGKPSSNSGQKMSNNGDEFIIKNQILFNFFLFLTKENLAF